MSADLTAFLRARLDEDEAHAHKDIWCAGQASGGTWEAHYGFNLSYSEVRVSGRAIARFTGDDEDEHQGNAGLAARMANATRPRAERMLREVKAKRAIIKWHPSEPMRHIDANRCPQCELTWPCPTIRVIAAVWNGHPDYRPEWAP